MAHDADERAGGAAGRSMKRRGILAAAAAVVAGIVAKQAGQPAAAAAGGTQGTPLILGANPTGGTAANTATQPTMLFNGAIPSLPYYVADAFVAASQNGTGVQGYGFGEGYGVAGYNVNGTQSSSAGVYGSANGVIGVYGVSNSGVGVQGESGQDNTFNTTGFPIGVRGSVSDTGYAVYGKAGNGFGVYGTVAGGIGVNGLSTSNIGVRGEIPANSTTANTVAVQGVNQSTGAGGVGVSGQSATGYGVVGYTAGGSASLAGISDHTNIPAFAGGNSAPGGLAASFSGLVYVNGPFVVADPANKHGAIKHPDGSYRLLYSMESPESWLEDFGKGQLTAGRADVRLDPDFAAVTQTQEYYVFLTERGETNGLFVSGQTASGFTVQERNKGTASGAFYWRVVARPKSEQKVARLGNFVPPNVKLPDPATLPKPSAPLPAKKP